MKYLMKYLLLVIFLLFSTVVEAAPKMSVKKSTELQFGDVASSVSGSGTVVVPATSDSRIITGSLYGFGGQVTRAKFKVSKGTANAFVTIVLPSSLTVSKGGVTLTVNNLTLSVSNVVQLDANGALTFYVGGTLNIPTNQTPQKGLKGDLFVEVLE